MPTLVMAPTLVGIKKEGRLINFFTPTRIRLRQKKPRAPLAYHIAAKGGPEGAWTQSDHAILNRSTVGQWLHSVRGSANHSRSGWLAQAKGTAKQYSAQADLPAVP